MRRQWKRGSRLGVAGLGLPREAVSACFVMALAAKLNKRGGCCRAMRRGGSTAVFQAAGDWGWQLGTLVLFGLSSVEVLMSLSAPVPLGAGAWLGAGKRFSLYLQCGVLNGGLHWGHPWLWCIREPSAEAKCNPHLPSFVYKVWGSTGTGLVCSRPLVLLPRFAAEMLLMFAGSGCEAVTPCTAVFQDGLVKTNMEKLTFYALSAPEKLDRIGAYLSERLIRDVSRHRYG